MAEKDIVLKILQLVRFGYTLIKLRSVLTCACDALWMVIGFKPEEAASQLGKEVYRQKAVGHRAIAAITDPTQIGSRANQTVSF